MLSLLEDVRRGKKVNLFPIYFAPSPFFLLVQLSGLHSAINFHIIKNKIFVFFRFCWDIKKFRPDFNIYPVEGYITPGMEVTFEVTFEPKQEKKDIRYDVSIKINIHEMKNKKKI
jgi:hydrocephalus-inducing protein